MSNQKDVRIDRVVWTPETIAVELGSPTDPTWHMTTQMSAEFLRDIQYGRNAAKDATKQ